MDAARRPSPPRRGAAALCLSAAVLALAAEACTQLPQGALLIAEQGSFMAGGGLTTHSGVYDPRNPRSQAGQTRRGDHAYAFYQIPVSPRPYPLVFEHGLGQSARTWETTPDGREGFQNLFLRRGFAVYLIDQPRRGRAARSLSPTAPEQVHDEQLWFNRSRLGVWPDYFAGVQFPRDEASLDQFFRQMVPSTGPRDLELYADGVAAVLERSGPAILVTHSQGGAVGWLTALRSAQVRAIVAFEPGGAFPFVAAENPDQRPTESGHGETRIVEEEELQAYTRIPIVNYYGDNLGDWVANTHEQEQWRRRKTLAGQWAAAINFRGGDVSVVHLPTVGVHGNTHFMMSDLNNEQVAELMAQWLHERGLD